MNKFKHGKVKVDNVFNDLRGSIINITNLPIKNVAYINSKKNTIRSNHYHKTDWHFIYVITKKKYRSLLVKKGELIFTPPKIIHATYFLENTEILALSRNLRDTKNYEKDTVRVELIKKKDYCIE